MDALDFIRADVARVRTVRARRVAMAATLCAVGVALGLGWRRDLVGLTSAAAVASIAVLTLAAGVLAFADGKARSRWVAVAAALVLVVVSGRWLGGGMPLPYVTRDVFWSETLLCFGKGLVACALAAALVGAFVARVLPAFERRDLVVASAAPWAVGVLMLAVHCPSDHAGHVALGHWLPGVVFFPIAYAVLRAVALARFAPVLRRPGLVDDAAVRLARDAPDRRP